MERETKVFMLAFIITVIVVPIAYQQGVFRQNEAFHLLSTQYSSLLSDYSELQTDYEIISETISLLQSVNQELVQRYNDLETQYSTLQVQYSSLNTTYYDLLGNYTLLETLYEELQELYDALSPNYNALRDIISSMPPYQKLQVWATAVRNYYHVGNWYDIPLFMKNMTLHNSMREDPFDYVTSLLYNLTGISNTMSMMYDVIKNHLGFQFWNASLSKDTIFDGIVSRIDVDDKAWALSLYGNYTYYTRSSLECILEGMGDQVDQAIMVASALELEGYLAAVAILQNDTFTRGWRAFALVRDSTYGNWTLGSYDDWLVLDPAWEHGYTELPSWVSDFIAEEYDWINDIMWWYEVI